MIKISLNFVPRGPINNMPALVQTMANSSQSFSAMIIVLQSVATAIACAVASDVIHAQLITRIIHAPNAFFDTTPLGRILNRFSQDINALDIRVRLNLSTVFRGITSLATTSLAICYSTPLFITVLIPIAVAYRVLQVNTARCGYNAVNFSKIITIHTHSSPVRAR